MTVFEELKVRGLIAQSTNEEKLKQLFENEKVTFYIGFDATADSLHVGHFLQLVVMKHMQDAGHYPIALLGTGTTMVGDPTGKTDMRKMLTVDEINDNAQKFQDQMAKYIDFSSNKAEFVRNGDWLLKMNYLPFLRDVGVHFSVNKMLTAECFKTRLEKGLSFIEFNYMLMQSYDFLHLYREKGCKVELGGDDQWSNIINGVDLVRRVEGAEVYGMTFTLLTTKEGKKMGKTEKGAVWLNPDKTTPYEFFQYWRNIDDADVIHCMKLITFIPLEEIEVYQAFEGTSKINDAKEKLAFELTKMVHGEQEAQKALDVAKSLFQQGCINENMPQTELAPGHFKQDGIDLLDLLQLAGLTKSRGEGRRLVEQGGIRVNDDKISDCTTVFYKENFEQDFIIKKGKKVYHKVTYRAN